MLYYDIFSYPLTLEEIHNYLGTNHIANEDLKSELSNLCKIGFVFERQKYYMLEDNELLINKRLEGNRLAEKKMKTAIKISRFISKFPFIRAVMLSGSISKGYMEADADIDYFIVTHPNRVWLSRLLLMTFKKIFLLNSKKIFCINYLVDSEKLEIEEKNIFTATELITLVPTYGLELYDELYDKNIWIKQYYPNFPKRNTQDILNSNDGFFKSISEKFLWNKLGDRLDDFSMSLFEKFNRKRYKNYNPEEFKIAFKSSKKESKHHPRFFQKKVLVEFGKKIQNFEERHKVSLS